MNVYVVTREYLYSDNIDSDFVIANTELEAVSKIMEEDVDEVKRHCKTTEEYLCVWEEVGIIISVELEDCNI